MDTLTPDMGARIRARLETLAPAQQRVAQLLLDEPDWALRANVEEIAARAEVSAPTIVRTCRALGYSGLREFKLELARELALGTPYLHRAVGIDDGSSETLRKILFGAAAALTDLERQIDLGVLEGALGRLAQARRVDCYGVGTTSNYLATDAQSRFFRLGLNAHVYLDAHMQLMAATTLGAHDVVFVASHVGRMPTLLEAVRVAREQGAAVVALTQPGTPLAALADHPLTLTAPDDTTLRVGTEAVIAHLALLEILTVGVGQRRGPLVIAQFKRFRDVLRTRSVDRPNQDNAHDD